MDCEYSITLTSELVVVMLSLPELVLLTDGAVTVAAPDAGNVS